MEKERSKATPPFEIETFGVDFKIIFFFLGRPKCFTLFFFSFTLRRAVIWCVSSDFRHVTFSLTGHTTSSPPTPNSPTFSFKCQIPFVWKTGKLRACPERRKKAREHTQKLWTNNKGENEKGKQKKEENQATLQLFHRSCKTWFAFTMWQEKQN